MARVLLVDWLGRGGIAQTTEVWAMELGARAHEVDVVTRADRELGNGVVSAYRAPHARTRVGAHRGVVHTAAALVRDLRPDWVVVQNYVVPFLERPVYDAASTVGARLAVVIHDHRLHARSAGSRAGLAANLARADVVVAHTEFVAERVRALIDGRVIVLPHPVPLGLLAHPRCVPAALATPAQDATRWCAHFGVLRRGYKGTGLVRELAASGVEGWRFMLLGTGAGTAAGTDAVTVDGFVEPGVLVGAVSASDVTLAPYRMATQSGVVVLAHVLGSVPVATSVGGIPEQIDHGVDGILVDRDAELDVWRGVLDELRDDERRKELARAGEARAWADHDAFASGIAELVR